jgi:hypothetical protein
MKELSFTTSVSPPIVCILERQFMALIGLTFKYNLIHFLENGR